MPPASAGLPIARLLLPKRHGAVGSPAPGRDADGAASRRLIARHLGQTGVEEGQGVVLAAFGGGDAAGAAGRPHHLLEGLSVAVAEGFALRLPVVGEHHEPVGARGVGAGPGDPGDLAIEVAEHGEAVLALDPGVVRHLVVGEKGRVDRRPPGEDVADHGGDLQVALDDGRPGADQGIGTGAPDPRPDVIAHLRARGAALSDHVDEDEDDRLGDGIGAREIGRVVAADRPAPAQRGAHRQHRVRGVAGEDVGATGAVRVQEAAAVGAPPLELFGIARVVGDDRRASLLLPPAEGRHVLVRAMKQPGLAGAGLRGPVGLPALQAVRSGSHPRRQVRSAVLGERALEHVVREAVDLEKRHTGDVGLDQGLPPAKLALHHVAGTRRRLRRSPAARRRRW